uniref:Uncharacterized protein n=1 Tax=Sphaerodactylus townsendi TaxID=933632 RepID=A0ACB8FC59_9SAUR
MALTLPSREGPPLDVLKWHPLAPPRYHNLWAPNVPTGSVILHRWPQPDPSKPIRALVCSCYAPGSWPDSAEESALRSLPHARLFSLFDSFPSVYHKLLLMGTRRKGDRDVISALKIGGGVEERSFIKAGVGEGKGPVPNVQPDPSLTRLK